jgi:L-ascorbate metabolism protein UlaG (beta-lactamase superfamily)
MFKKGGKLIVYKGLEAVVRKILDNVEIIVLDLNEIFTENNITFKPVFAMDGVGEIQSSWIVEDAATKIFHGGDTIWHNQFWKLGKENPNIDYAFLPVNGVVVNFEIIGLEYSPVPASLNLKEAFAAAHLYMLKSWFLYITDCLLMRNVISRNCLMRMIWKEFLRKLDRSIWC